MLDGRERGAGERAGCAWAGAEKRHTKIAETAEKRSSEPPQNTEGCLVAASIPPSQAFRRGAEQKDEKCTDSVAAQKPKKEASLEVPSRIGFCVAIPALLAGAFWYAGEGEEDEEAAEP